jgi:hypothetical protein
MTTLKRVAQASELFAEPIAQYPDPPLRGAVNVVASLQRHLQIRPRRNDWFWQTAANFCGAADLSGYEVTSDAVGACQER